MTLYYVIAFSKVLDAFMLLMGINEKFRLENHSSHLYITKYGALYTRRAEREPFVIKAKLLEVMEKKIRLFRGPVS